MRTGHLIVAALLVARAARGSPPELVVSVEGATLRVETGQSRRVFPVAVGRLLPDGNQIATGTFHTGPDPKDARFYLASRNEPAFHGGLPFLRLDRRSGPSPDGSGGDQVFGIHGPVTPTLIWGRVTAGCIRMQPRDLRWLFRFAQQNPGLPVHLLPGPDLIGGQRVEPDPGLTTAPVSPACPEAALGVRRLRRAALGSYLHDRVCGGVDHWFAVELKGGETLQARLEAGGGLRLELYGIRGISQVAAGRTRVVHTVPLSHRNRGDRYLRILAEAKGRGPIPYTLELAVGVPALRQ